MGLNGDSVEVRQIKNKLHKVKQLMLYHKNRNKEKNKLLFKFYEKKHIKLLKELIKVEEFRNWGKK